MLGKTGQYTGDWKGDRPEGYGEFSINNSEYIKGNWENGYLSGEGEYQILDENRRCISYDGECSEGAPSGYGEMYIRYSDEFGYIRILGDFSEGGKLYYYGFDEDDVLVDIGLYNNGEYTSFLNNYNAKGMDYIPRSLKEYSTQNSISFGRMSVSQRGEYFGEVDENGIPNGYGYLRTDTTYSWDNGYQNQVRDFLGEWKNGEIEGKVTFLSKLSESQTTLYEERNWLWTTTKETNQKRNMNKKIRSSMKNGRFYGETEEYTYTVYEPSDENDGLIYRHYADYEDPKNYMLCDDGKYRTIEDRLEYKYLDGRFGYESYTYFCNEDPEGKATVFPDGAEGEYYDFDRNGDFIEYGVPKKCSGYFGREQLSPPGKGETLKQQVTNALVIGAFVVGTVAFLDYVFSDDDAEWCENFRQQQQDNNKILYENWEMRDELKKKAENERQLGNYEDAEKYEREAREHDLAAW